MEQTAGERIVRWWLRGSTKQWPEILYAGVGAFLLALGAWDGFHAAPFALGALVVMMAVVAFERRQYGLIIRRLEQENASLKEAVSKP